jgi:hypothetical protein
MVWFVLIEVEGTILFRNRITMAKLVSSLQKIMPRRLASKSQSAEFEIPVYDVTACIGEIDLGALDVIRWAPCWMSRAERLLLFSLAFGLRPARYLEIGTFKGGSSLIIAAAMAASDNPGRMVCVDPDPQIDPEHWKQLEPRTVLVKGASPDILPHAQEVAGGPFDLVLIDGDHSYSGALRDASGVMEHVAERAHLIFHDGYNLEVARAIEEFICLFQGRVIDFGLLTREVAFVDQVRWGGLHMVQVQPRPR